MSIALQSCPAFVTHGDDREQVNQGPTVSYWGTDILLLSLHFAHWATANISAPKNDFRRAQFSSPEIRFFVIFEKLYKIKKHLEQETTTDRNCSEKLSGGVRIPEFVPSFSPFPRKSMVSVPQFLSK